MRQISPSEKNMGKISQARVPEGAIAAWWLGQAGFAFKTPAGTVLFADAYLSDSIGERYERARRTVPVPIEPEDVRCNIFLCTHDHGDHLDPETISRLKYRAEMTFVGPRNCVRHFRELGVPKRQMVLLEAGDEVRLGDVTLHATFCVPNEETVLDSIGFLLSTPDGPTIYHTGDTGYTRFLGYLAKYEIDVMLTCINGRFGNLNIREASRLAQLLRPALVVPHHFELFRFNQADPQKFCARLAADGVRARCHIPRHMRMFLCRRRK